MNWSNPPLIIWICAILTGVLFSSYLYLLQYAYKFADPVKLSPINYSVVVFTGILDWLIYDHIPGVVSAIGMVLVTFGGILAILLHEKDNKELKHHWH
jgi:drug/metabolite transporter (DMT)-like permease